VKVTSWKGTCSRIHNATGILSTIISEQTPVSVESYTPGVLRNWKLRVNTSRKVITYACYFVVVAIPCRISSYWKGDTLLMIKCVCTSVGVVYHVAAYMD